MSDLSFRGPGGTGLPSLAGLPGRAVAAPARVLEVERFDTDDLRLAAAGVSLVLHREDGALPCWRLELPGGESRRVVLPEPGIRPQPPAELAGLVRGPASERELRPVGRVRTVRTETRLLDAADRPLATVVHDEVALATLGAATEVRAWTEIVVDAAPELAEELVRRVADLGLRPGGLPGEAELDRLLRPPPRRRAGRKGSAGAVLLAYLGAQADRLAAEDLRVRRDEPDSVHQMRVAARRLRSALRAYRGLLDEERVAPVGEALRELGRALAPARDAEVLAARVDAELAALPPELLLGPVRAQATRHFARAAAQARADALAALDGPAYTALRRDLDALLADPPLTRRARKRARTGLRRGRERAARRLDRAMTAADRGDAALHAARKAGKRLRYAEEVARPVTGKAGKRTTKALERLQDALGEHQDAVVARAALRELGATAENGFAFGVLYGRAAARAEAAERELPELWRAVRSSRRKR